jgi:putative ABC transport system permease protein
MGRTFTADDDKPGSRVAVLTYNFWRDQMGGDQHVLGREITLDGANYSVVGVMPPRFEFPEETDLWVPFGFTDKEAKSGIEYLNCVGVLRPGVTKEQLAADMRRLTDEQLRLANQGNAVGWFTSAMPLRDSAVGDVKKALWLLFATVGCVLFIACANVANVLLARAVSRQKEMAIRSSLGAARGRLVRQLLTEGTLLGLMGSGLGLLLGYSGLRLMMKLLPSQLPSYIHVDVDVQVMLFTLALGVLTGLLFSVFPAFQMTGDTHHEALKQGGRSSSTTASHRLRAGIVAFQLAAAMILLVCAGLLIQTFVRLQQTSPGFTAKGVLTAIVELPEKKYEKPSDRMNFYNGVLDRLRAAPGVKSAAVVSTIPLHTGWSQGFSVAGKHFEVTPHAFFAAISPEYFSTFSIPLLRGRLFSDADGREGTAPVAIIDTKTAHHYFGDEDPIGRQLLFGGPGIKETPHTIIGIVGPVKHHDPMKEESKGEVYVPMEETVMPSAWIVVRSEAAPMTLAPTLRSAVLAMDPTQAIQEVKPMQDILDEFIAQPRFNMALLGCFAGLALLLAMIGIYGVIAYFVSQRTYEIGVRIALGAQKRDVLRMIVWQACKLVMIGVAFGLSGAFIATRTMASLLFGVKSADPATFAAMTLLLALTSLAAGLPPALRAMRVSPLVALRSE